MSAPTDREKALAEALEDAENTLRSMVAALGTIDSDERYRAREEHRSANVHTMQLRQAEQARKKIMAAKAALTAPTPVAPTDGPKFTIGSATGTLFIDGEPTGTEIKIFNEQGITRQELLARLNAAPTDRPSDSQMLDWLDEHEAAIEVNDEELLTCRVSASDDFKLHGFADPYNARLAIRAAMEAQP